MINLLSHDMKLLLSLFEDFNYPLTWQRGRVVPGRLYPQTAFWGRFDNGLLDVPVDTVEALYSCGMICAETVNEEKNQWKMVLSEAGQDYLVQARHAS